MTAPELFHRIRPNLTCRTALALWGTSTAHGELKVALEQNFDRLEAALTSENLRILDAATLEWSAVQGKIGSDAPQTHAAELYTHIATAAITAAREILSEGEALALISALLPPLLYCQQHAAAAAHQGQVANISDDLLEVTHKLERLDRTKSNFISVAGHELRTPLTLIEGYATMLGELEPGRNHQAQTLLNGIHAGVQRLGEIIDDMIDVSLIDSDSLALRRQPLRLNRLFRSLAPEFSAIAEQRGLHIEIRSFSGGEKLTLADPRRLRQAFGNLLANAVKYTPDGGRICVDGRSLPGFVEVYVADTGIGIDPQDQVAIFEKFEHLGEASLHSSGKTKFKGGGPGLGLAITKGIIRAHGGEIWVESPGHDEVKCPGTTFHVLLPHHPKAADPRLANF